MSKDKTKKAKTKKDDRKVVSSCVDALEAALDHADHLQLRIYDLEAELANCEGTDS